MTCSNCGEVRSSYQPFLDLNLGLEGRRTGLEPVTLQGCLDEEYTGSEDLDDYTCNACGKAESGAILRRNIERPPKVLCIQFKASLGKLFYQH